MAFDLQGCTQHVIVGCPSKTFHGQASLSLRIWNLMDERKRTKSIEDSLAPLTNRSIES